MKQIKKTQNNIYKTVIAVNFYRCRFSSVNIKLNKEYKLLTEKFILRTELR